MRLTLVVGLLALASAHARGVGQPQSSDHRTVWSGVYTAAQAEHGASAFQEHCESCHGPELRGNEGPALAGPAFMRNWTGLSVLELFRHIKVAMPEDAVSSVSDADKLDILTFIFQRNGFPAGTQPLTLIAGELAAIRFEGKDGPEPPPGGSTVFTVGCLTHAGGNTWTLSRASAPVRTTLEAAHDPDVHNAAETPLGSATLRLLDVPAGVRDGQKVAAIGLMIRTTGAAGSDGVNVLELSRIADDCSR